MAEHGDPVAGPVHRWWPGRDRDDPSGRGRKRVIGDEVVETVVTDTLTTVPEDGSVSWTTRSMAKRHGIGKDTVASIWRARNL